MQRLVAFALLVVCVGLMAGCGSSRHLSLGVQRAAIAAAKRQARGHASMFPASSGTIACQIPTRMVGYDFTGRCTSSVSSRGAATEVSLIESATVNGRKEAGHETFLVDRNSQAHFVEISNWFPQNAP
jgi:hypothetical protein